MRKPKPTITRPALKRGNTKARRKADRDARIATATKHGMRVKK